MEWGKRRGVEYRDAGNGKSGVSSLNPCLKCLFVVAVGLVVDF